MVMAGALGLVGLQAALHFAVHLFLPCTRFTRLGFPGERGPAVEQIWHM